MRKCLVFAARKQSTVLKSTKDLITMLDISQKSFLDGISSIRNIGINRSVVANDEKRDCEENAYQSMLHSEKLSK